MTSNDILSSETLSKAGNLEIFDENRSKIKFSSFYTDKRTLVIFIRHFMCGNCMEYVRALSTGIDPSELLAQGIELVIIGCGDPVLIKDYAASTGAKYPIYADPSQSLYKLFGLVRNLTWGKKDPEYMSFGLVGGIFKGISAGLKAGPNAFKSGDKKQNGGEFLLGPGETCTWGHRMQNTRDHAEIVDLRRAVGLAKKESNGVSKPETNGSKPAVVPEQNGSPAAPAVPAEPAASNVEPATA